MDNLDYDLYKYGGGSQQVSVPKPSLRRNSSDGKPAGTQVSPSPAQSKPESPEKEKAPSSNTGKNTGKGVAEQEKPVYRDSQKVRHTTSSSDKKRKKQPQSDTIQIRNFPLDVYAIVAKEFPKASSRTAALTAYCIVHSDAIVDMSALSDDVRTLVEEYNGADRSFALASKLDVILRRLSSLSSMLDGTKAENEIALAYLLFDKLGFRQNSPLSPSKVQFLEHGVSDMIEQLRSQSQTFRKDERIRDGRPIR